MDDYVIPKSSAPVRRFAILSAVLILAACIVVTLFFSYAVSVAPNAQKVLVGWLWGGMFAVWLLSLFVTAKNHSSKQYVLTNQALSIQKKGWLGRASEQLLRYDTIMSVNTISRAHGAYGTIELMLDQQPAVLLTGVLLPEEHARRIKKVVMEKS
jgi:hypothetical protein